MKKRLQIFLFGFLFICTSQKVFSQTYFNNLYSPDYTLTGSTLVEQDGYVVLGQRLTFVDRQIMILKLNSFGDTIWQKYYSNNTDIYYSKKILKSNDGYIIAGSVKDSANTNDFDFFLSLFDTNGVFQWMHRYGGNDFEAVKDVFHLNNGHLIIVGSTSSFGAGFEDYYLVKTDNLGNLLWQKTFGGGYRYCIFSN